jgi:hypothetical protein
LHFSPSRPGPRTFLFCLLHSWGWQASATIPNYWLRWGLLNCFSGLVLNCDPSDFHLLSCWDCRHEPSHFFKQIFDKVFCLRVSLVLTGFELLICLPFESLLSAGITGVYRHAWLIMFSEKTQRLCLGNLS